MADSTKCGAGRRSRKLKKSKKSRKQSRRTRRGGFAPASFSGAITGANGQPAGADFRAVGVSGSSANPNASSYTQNTAGTYAAYGGRKRGSRRSRRSRKYRIRGGGGTGGAGETGSRIFTSFEGESVGASAPGGAIRVPTYAGSQPS
jgi:hypothetical protein